jgi:predicted PurR-regulated permease PerM
MTATTSRVTLGVLGVLAVVLAALMIRPFATALFLAAVMAAALHPWASRLAGLLKGRRALAAGLFTLLVVLAVVAPLATLTAVAVKQVVEGIAWVRQALESRGVHGLVGYLPPALQMPVEQALAELPQGAEQIQALVQQEGGRAAKAVGGLLSATGSALLQTVLFLIAFFFLLVDGERLVAWLKEMVPLKPGQLAELLEDFRRVTVAVLVSTLATAGMQAAVAFVGYLLARVPNALFFALVTFFLALVPVGGASLAVLALAALKLATGHPLAALFLAVWAVGAVSTVDNVVKPLLMRGGLAIHGAVIFFAFLGGLAAFGPVGLLLGPLAVAFLVAVMRLYRRDSGGTR